MGRARPPQIFERIDSFLYDKANMLNKLLLLPQPHHITFLDGTTVLPDGKLIVLDGPDPQPLFFTALSLQQALREQAGVNWSIVAGQAVPAEQVGLTVSLVPGATHHPEGYHLAILPHGIFIVAGTPAGAFYAAQTLRQILAQSPTGLPFLQVADWPDYPHRGVMLDVSRDKVPTLDTLFELVNLLASWKINQFQLYTEHTFAYRQHPEIWAEASPLTGEEILRLDAYCRERFVQLVPNQNTFGHLERWLTHERYKPLAECPNGFYTEEWGFFDQPFSLCPAEPGSLELVRSLMDELLPHFNSRLFNIGGDETLDLGLGRSREVVAQHGRGPVYLDFLLQIYREAKTRGRTIQFWGDIIITHPELVAALPHDVIALEWGYEADHPFDRNGALFAATGIPFYVCPGTSSWRTVAGRTQNALRNLRNAAENGLKHGAVGYLITDWGDKGHWQPLPVSYLGFAYGAALAWANAANRDEDLTPAVSRYAFGDPSGRLGRLAYDLGNAYLEPGLSLHNSSVLFYLLQESPKEITARTKLSEEKLRQTLAYLDRVTAGLAPDQDGLIERELNWVAAMLRHACRRGIWALRKARGQEDPAQRRQLAGEAEDLLAGFRSLWLARNRAGGLRDSQAPLLRMVQDYQIEGKTHG